MTLTVVFSATYACTALVRKAAKLLFNKDEAAFPVETINPGGARHNNTHARKRSLRRADRRPRRRSPFIRAVRPTSIFFCTASIGPRVDANVRMLMHPPASCRFGVSFPGKGDSWNRQEVVKQGLSVIDHAPDNLHTFVKGLRLLKGEKMTDEKLREIWRLLPEIGPGVMGKVLDRYVAHEEPTLFGLLNAGTATFWHNRTMTSADFQNNDLFTTGLLRYAFQEVI